MAYRSLVTAVVTAVLLCTGLLAPASATAPAEVPETRAARLDGLERQVVRGASGRRGVLSRPTPTPIPFSMVGFELPPGADVEFRTSVDGVTWTAWQHAHASVDGPDTTAAGRGATRFSDPVWVREAAHIQTRVDGAAGLAAPERVAVHLIDTLGLGRSWGRRLADRLAAAWRGTPAPAAAEPAQPLIVSRAQWGADEDLRDGSPSYAERALFGVVHHTAGSNRYSRKEAPAVVRGVYRFHTQSRGWSDIGYNFLVDRYGTVYEGRYGGIEQAVIGAHAGGFNTGSFGVSLMGDFTSVAPTAAAQAALEQLLAWKLDVHHIDVTGRTRATSLGSSRYPAGREVTVDNLTGHRVVSATSCPGARLYDRLPLLRERVVALQGPVLLDDRVTPSKLRLVNGSSIDGALTFTARLRPEGAWRLDVFSPTGAPVHSAAGAGDKARAQWLPAGMARGRYTYAFSSTGRRTAEGSFELGEPTITVATSARRALLREDGAFTRPLRFAGTLYPEASWQLSVTDAGGGTVFSAGGRGQRLDVEWTGGLRESGTYRWAVTADDVTPVTGTVRVLYDRVDRTARSSDPATAAVALSRETFADLAARHVVLTRPDLPGHGLAAAALAGSDGPVLYVRQDSLEQRTLDEMARVLPPLSTVYVMGDDTVVSDAALAAAAARYTIVRLGDASAKNTAAAVADVVVGRTGAATAVVAGTGSWRKSVTAVTYAAAHGLPVLLTDAKRLSPVTAEALDRNGVTATIVAGGRRAVSDDVLRLLPAPDRVSARGKARTARRVARSVWGRRAPTHDDRWLFASLSAADAWTRVVAAAPLAARNRAPVLVAEAAAVPEPTSRYLARLGYEPRILGSGLVLGSKRVVGKKVAGRLSRLLQ